MVQFSQALSNSGVGISYPMVVVVDFAVFLFASNDVLK